MSSIPYPDWDKQPKILLGDLGAQPPMPDIATEFQGGLHSFAESVMRPIGQRLDRLSAEEVCAEGSEFWDFRKQYVDLGIGMEAVGAMSPEELSVVFPIIFEELGWGDAGLAISAAGGLLPAYMSAKFGRLDLLQKYPDTMLGCWGITEADHGTDSLDASKQIFHANGSYGRPNCVAKVTDGKVIINGAKSAWVSNGPVADICILYCAAETADGIDPHRGVCVLVPMDADGVSRGLPLEKMGQRALPQGEVIFDNVEVDIENLLAAPEDYKKAVYCIHTEANTLMGAIFTGCARAAYELAYDYAHERKQGGVPIIRHQDVAKRIFNMARKVEISRALTHRVLAHNFLQPMPVLQAAMMAKVTATNHAFEVASDAIQMFGGNGVALEYPVEKIFRDARSSMIEDGCNEILSIKGGMNMIDEDRL
jgi:acyl-CoA dehydrogenase